ncbi:MAG: class I SAM-dependent methyltransferase [bacterium]|nr:class I SAM-dependent methyltransferase [bacterium]
MYGKEQALVQTIFLKKLYYRLIGTAHIGERRRFHTFSKALDQIDLSKYNRALNAGSGNGGHSFYLAGKYPHLKITNAEIDERKIANCRRILEKTKLSNLEFVRADLLALKFDQEFDFIFTVHVLEHIEEDETVLANLFQALKPGGKLLVYVPAVKKKDSNSLLNRRLAQERRKIFEEDFGHVREGYRKEDLEEKLNKAGFKVCGLRREGSRIGQLASDIGALLGENYLLKALIYPFLFFLVWLEKYLSPSEKNGSDWIALAGR